MFITFFSHTCCSLFPILVPNTSMFSAFHFIGTGPCVCPAFLPTCIPSVLSMFSLLPVAASNMLIISKLLKIACSLSKVSVASPVYWLILLLFAVPGTVAPSILGSFRIAFPNVSATIVYNSGDKGKPCLTLWRCIG